MRRFFRRGLAVLTAAVLVCILALPGFAYEPNGNGTVIIPEGVTSLSNGSIPKTPSNLINVKTVYVPSSVKTIESGTFTGFINLRNVVIRNDKGAVDVARGATSGSTRILYSGAPGHTTTQAPSHTAAQTSPVEEHGNSSTKAAGRWVQELREQTTKSSGKQVVAETPETETITYTDENGEIMIPLPGEANTPEPDPSTGSRGLRVVSWILVGLAIASAGFLVFLKVKKK